MPNRERQSADSTDEEQRSLPSTIEDEVERIADREAEETAVAVATSVVRQGIRPLTTLMLIALCVSLLLHGLTIWRLLSLRSTLRDEVDQLSQRVVAAKSQTVSYDLPINERIPVNVDIPVREALTIPISTQVRIQQNVNLPIDTGLGSFNVPVPIDVTIPVSTTVPININQSVTISTTVPIQLNVPIKLDMSSNQFAGYLDRIRDALLRLRDEF